MNAAPHLIYNFIPVFFRALGLMLCLPLEQGLQTQLLRIGLSAGLSALVSIELQTEPSFALFTIPGELLIGFCLGLPILMVVNLAQAFGEVFDIARGQNISDMHDPLHGQSSSYSSILLQYLSWSSLLLLGILDLSLGVFYKSFSLFPAAELKLELSAAIGLHLMSFLSEILADFSALLLPLVTLFLLIEIGMAFLSKLLNRTSLQSEAMLIKSYLGFLVLLGLSQLGFAPAILKLATPSLELLKS